MCDYFMVNKRVAYNLVAIVTLTPTRITWVIRYVKVLWKEERYLFANAVKILK